MGTAAIYVRVSTTEQDSAHQLPDCRRLAAARGWNVVETYREDGVSGAAQKRPQLERMLADAHAGRFKTLIIWSLDRLSRRGIGDVAGIVAKLDAAGVALVSIREPWADTTSPMRDLLVAVMGWVAQQERERLLERLAAARARLEKEGRSWGRPRRLDATAAERVQRMRAEGKSARQIAVALKVPRTTVRRVLARAE